MLLSVASTMRDWKTAFETLNIVQYVWYDQIRRQLPQAVSIAQGTGAPETRAAFYTAFQHRGMAGKRWSVMR